LFIKALSKRKSFALLEKPWTGYVKENSWLEKLFGLLGKKKGGSGVKSANLMPQVQRLLTNLGLIYAFHQIHAALNPR
jgi:hypothetical protein